MYQLSKEQKISNLDELINSKRKKVERLEEEIKNLENKRAKLSNKQETNISSSQNSTSRPEWSNVFGQKL